MIIEQIQSQIFNTSSSDFEDKALRIFRLQYESVAIYKKYIDLLGIDVNSILRIEQIPFLPIQFFKSNKVIHASKRASLVFESSGTTGEITSKHYVADETLYKLSFRNGFHYKFGNIEQYCILGLLPSYLERTNSSLVYMVNDLIQLSKHTLSGFYLHNHEALIETLKQVEAAGQKTLLFGVTFALLDFAEKYSTNLKCTQIIETGGMKGRREELTRTAVHQILKDSCSLSQIYSEYGMTELLSQAYSLSNECFETPSWMKILVRDQHDPFSIQHKGKGVLNIIDFANLYSCSFIATDDLGELYEDGSFKVTGRMERSDLRGCSLLVV